MTTITTTNATMFVINFYETESIHITPRTIVLTGKAMQALLESNNFAWLEELKPHVTSTNKVFCSTASSNEYAVKSLLEYLCLSKSLHFVCDYYVCNPEFASNAVTALS